MWKLQSETSDIIIHKTDQVTYNCHNSVTNLIHFHFHKHFIVSAHNLQPANSYNCTQLTPKTAGVVPPEDGRLTPETCRGVRHNKVFEKVKVY
jgi:hypothetical protein